jgi:hypothetical protein
MNYSDIFHQSPVFTRPPSRPALQPCIVANGGDLQHAEPGSDRIIGLVHFDELDRQTIEAGIKESKQVFYLHHIKVRSEPAIYLQECFVVFAANFIRWASIGWRTRRNRLKTP